MKRFTIAVAIAALAVPVAAQAAPSAGTTVKAPLSASVVQRGEVRIVGKVTTLTASKITVTNATRSKTFLIPAGFDLGGVQKGDRVEAEGEKEGGKLVMRSIHLENRAAAAAAGTYSRSGSDDPAGHDRGDDHGHHGGGHR